MFLALFHLMEIAQTTLSPIGSLNKIQILNFEKEEIFLYKISCAFIVLWWMPISLIARSYGKFVKNYQTDFLSGSTLYIPTSSEWFLCFPNPQQLSMISLCALFKSWPFLSVCGLIFISIITKYVDHSSMCLFVIYISSLVNYLFIPFGHFLLVHLCFCHWVVIILGTV